MAAIPAGLWAPSMSSGGSPSIQSIRPGQRTLRTPGHCAGVEGESVPPQRLADRDGDGDVGDLKGTAQRSVHRDRAAVEDGVDGDAAHPCGPSGERHVGSDHGEHGADQCGSGSNLAEPGLGRAGHRPVAGLDDRGLLARDLRDRLPEQVLVIERDIGHGRDPEVEDVGAVEPATETDLTDQHLGVRLARGEDPGGGEDLEPRRLQLLGERLGCLPDA